MKQKTNRNNIEYCELCKTIKKRIKEDIQRYHEKIVEIATENQNSYKKARRKLTVGKRQIVTLKDGKRIISDRRLIIQYETNYYKNLNEAMTDPPDYPATKNPVPAILKEKTLHAIKGMKN